MLSILWWLVPNRLPWLATGPQETPWEATVVFESLVALQKFYVPLVNRVFKERSPCLVGQSCQFKAVPSLGSVQGGGGRLQHFACSLLQWVQSSVTSSAFCFATSYDSDGKQLVTTEFHIADVPQAAFLSLGLHAPDGGGTSALRS